MKRALLLLLGAAAISLPSHVSAQAASTQKPAAPAPATAKPAAPAAAAGTGRVIEVLANDQMKFDKTTIEAKPGEAITIRLKAVGTMPKIAMAHNFVLLTSTAKVDTFAAEAAAAGPSANYIPAGRKADILQFTKLIGGGETVDLTFKAPAKAGSYPYICSFPGHYGSGMKGMLVVK